LLADCSGQTLATGTVSDSSLPKGGAASVNIAIFTITRALDKRFSPFGVEYKCKLLPVWLTADLVEKAQMGNVRMQRYENSLVGGDPVRAMKKVTGKRKLSNM
jgi:hypothetical protein